MSGKKTRHLRIARSVDQDSLIGVNLETGKYAWADTLTKLLSVIEHYEPESYIFQGCDLKDSPYVLDWCKAKDKELFIRVCL